MAHLSIGIVGLPNVGKSTLFNALLKKQVAQAANYPFCTIEPNIGVVEVPDARLPTLANIVHTDTIVPAAVEFYDIAGLVHGASQGEGLGNQFLAHIREVAIITHVTRFFEDDNVVHVNNKVDPLEDIKTIETELILADLTTLEKQTPKSLQSMEKQLEAQGHKNTGRPLVQLGDELKNVLNEGNPARSLHCTFEEQEILKTLNLLTMKQVTYVCNVSEEQLEHSKETHTHVQQVLKEATGLDDPPYILLSVKMESELVALTPDEQQEYLAQYDLEESGLNRLITQAYRTLSLISFLTAGEKEVRAWTIKQGTLAPQAAGVIHTDFEKHFVKADIVPYETFVELSGWTKAREQGKVQLAGKDYVMHDGDVVEFKVNVT